jgi:predicted SAM-dependent methyltransferase
LYGNHFDSRWPPRRRQELRLDIDASVAPDIVATMTDMSRVADASVDAVFSSHNIEHLDPHEVPVALAGTSAWRTAAASRSGS